MTSCPHAVSSHQHHVAAHRHVGTSDSCPRCTRASGPGLPAAAAVLVSYPWRRIPIVNALPPAQAQLPKDGDLNRVARGP